MIDQEIIQDIEDFVTDIECAMTDFGLSRNDTLDELLNALETELSSSEDED